MENEKIKTVLDVIQIKIVLDVISLFLPQHSRWNKNVMQYSYINEVCKNRKETFVFEFEIATIGTN